MSHPDGTHRSADDTHTNDVKHTVENAVAQASALSGFGLGAPIGSPKASETTRLTRSPSAASDEGRRSPNASRTMIDLNAPQAVKPENAGGRLPAPITPPEDVTDASEPTNSEPTNSTPTHSEPTHSEPTHSEPTHSEPTHSEPTNVTRSPIMTSDDDHLFGASRTMIDLNAPQPAKGEKAVDHLPAKSTLGAVERHKEETGEMPARTGSNALANLSAKRKSFLLAVFCLAYFLDASGVSATFLMTAPIAEDLNITTGNQAWILGTYSMIFAATLLFAGRLADLYAPNRVYTIGFIGIAVFYLIISFMTNEYAFFVFRSVSAVLAVLTIPSAINMIIQMYPDPDEQSKKLGLFGLSAALANTLALVLAGVFLLANWRWYFRFVTIIVAPFSILAWYLMPKTEAVAEELPGAEKWKRMDLGGVFILLAALILFITAFTQAPTDGYRAAVFIAPLVISLVLLIVFFIWEQNLPRGYSLLPHDIWSFPNIFPLILQASAVFMWFATAQLRLATFFQIGLGNSAILAAVKLLPMGITALFVGGFTQAMPKLITRPRFIQPIASVLCFAGGMLFAFSNGGPGKDYWRLMFPGQIIGTAGGMIGFIGMNTNIIQCFPIAFAGVGGSFAQIILQIGGVIGISVQAGLLSTGDGTIQDWTGSKNSFFFTSAYILFTGLVFPFWYRQQKMPNSEGSAQAA